MTAAADRFDPYAVLGLPPGADAAAARRAWRRLVRHYHPDTAGHRPDAAEQLAQVNRAYAAIAAGHAGARADARAHDGAVTDRPARPAWVESPYPMPPRPRTGTTFLLALAVVALPAVALTLPGVPDRVARIWRGEGPGPAAFADARLDQVRRLITPTALAGAPSRAAPAAAPSVTAFAPPPIDPATIAAARRQARRLRRGGADPAVASDACAARAARRPGWAAYDFCAAAGLAADALDHLAAQARYETLGADPAAADARLRAIDAMVR